MKKAVLILMTVCLSLLICSVYADDSQKSEKPDQLTGKMSGLEIKNLLADKLEIADSIEIVVSHLVVPPNTMLPMHWHHGEEFIYVISGVGYVVQKGKEDTKIQTGDVFKIPLKQVHTAKTLEDSCTVVVFRIHEEGKPTRVLVEE